MLTAAIVSTVFLGLVIGSLLVHALNASAAARDDADGTRG